MATRIGVTGHRLLAPHPGLTAAVDAALAAIELRRPAPRALVSGFAEGADELVAARALDRGWTLHALLPLPVDAHATDLDRPDDFRRLLARATIVETIAPPLPRPDCYRAQGLALVDRSDELVARAIHADYTDRAEDTPYDIPWTSCPEVHESNRRQTDSLAAGLAAIGCDLLPLGGCGVPQVVLTAAEVDDLARREHDRGREERAAAGWRYGRRERNAQRLNPLLVPWEELPATAQADSCEAARRIPAVRALAGLEVLRLDAVRLSSPAG